MRLLLVEDEPEFASALCAALKKHDMIVDRALTVAQAMDIAMAGVHGAVPACSILFPVCSTRRSEPHVLR